MKYWEEMQSKWGFDDGGATPAGIEHYRAAYILAVNALAESLGSRVRAIAFNRGGIHNWCLILTVPMEIALKDPTEPLAAYELGDGETRDDAFDNAVELAMEEGIDSYVNTRVTLSKKSVKTLRALTAKTKEIMA